MRGDIHLKNDPSSGLQAISGSMQLIANFDQGALAPITGSIDNILVRSDNPKAPTDWLENGDPTEGTSRLSGQFQIGGGRVVDGEFTAVLTGVDSNADAPLSESIRGYRGDVLGAFYSANAAEVGGVLNAVRGDQVMAGVFGGVKQ